MPHDRPAVDGAPAGVGHSSNPEDCAVSFAVSSYSDRIGLAVEKSGPTIAPDVSPSQSGEDCTWFEVDLPTSMPSAA